MRRPAVRRLGVLSAGALTALTLAIGLAPGAEAALRGSASARTASLAAAHASAAATPATPRGLEALTVEGGRVELDWSDSAAAGRYQVYRDGIRIAASVRESRYDIRGLTDGRAYSFRVSAGASPPYSPWTSAVEVTPTAIPTGLKVVSVGSGKVELDWAGNRTAHTRYQVYQDGKRIADGPSDSRYTVTGLTNGRRYSFRVSAGPVQPYSEWTDAVTATPGTSPAPAPEPSPKPKPAPAGQLLWSADFESSAFDPFKDSFENVDAPEPELVATPVAQGTRAGRFEAPSGSPRNEVLMDGELTNGTTRFFGWSMQLAGNLSTESGWRVLAQWRHNGRNGSPPVSLKLQDGEYMIDGGWIDTSRSTNDVGETSQLEHYDLGSAGGDKGRYVRWVFGIRFAVGDPAQGWVSVWKNGVQLADRVPWRTMYRQKSNGRPFTSSLKFGIYRDAGIGGTDVVHHDDWRMGTTYASVAG